MLTLAHAYAMLDDAIIVAADEGWGPTLPLLFGVAPPVMPQTDSESPAGKPPEHHRGVAVLPGKGSEPPLCSAFVPLRVRRGCLSSTCSRSYSQQILRCVFSVFGGRCSQAIRRCVNKETEVLSALAQAVPQLLRPDGRFAALSFLPADSATIASVFAAEVRGESSLNIAPT